MKRIILYGFLLVFTLPVFGQFLDISGYVDWRRMEMKASVNVNLVEEGIRLPTGRIHAEMTISDKYPHLIRTHLLAIPVDSSSRVVDLLNRGEITLAGTDAISLSAGKVAPALSADLEVMSVNYTLNLNNLSSFLVMHSRTRDPIRVLTPTPVTEYTGIVILAHEELPIHGRHSSAFVIPCLFPKIWDTNMNLIYERNMVDPQNARAMVKYVPPESVFMRTPSGIDDELAEIVGRNPLRIIARGVFGINPTDPIIDRSDALLILSSEHNRRLLREGRVAIIIHNSMLITSF